MRVTIVLVAAILIAALGFVMLWRDGIESESTKSSKTNREVALACTTDMATQYHIHPILRIIVNGNEQLVPADIGVRSTCMNALHTHDMVGTIHVESPEQRDFTLGDFFAVWEQPFSKDKLLSYVADENRHIRVTVNGKEVDTYENTLLKDGDQIVISYESLAGESL